MHFGGNNTYHYGPILTQLIPPCGYSLGGTLVTIIGENLDDPTINATAFPAYHQPTVEIIYTLTDGTVVRTTGLETSYNSLDKSITFVTPNFGNNIWILETELVVFFKSLQGKSNSIPFQYGPFITEVQAPSSLHAGGGSIITVKGCGLAAYSGALYINVNGNSICSNITVESDGLSDGYDVATCITGDSYCFQNGELSVTFIPTYLSAETISNLGNISIGPVVTSTSISPISGSRLGGTTVTLTGVNFLKSIADSPSWNAYISLYSIDFSDIFIPEVQATIISDHAMTFVTPPGLFDLTVQVSVTFGTEVNGTITAACPTIYTAGTPSFHYGPLCSNTVPTNGYYSGGELLTIYGTGFSDSFNGIGDTEVRFCPTRLVNAPFAFNDACESQNRNTDSAFSMTGKSIVVTTPSYRTGVTTCVGGNRLVGDEAEVWLHFYAPGTNDTIDIPINQLRPGLEVARIQCPNNYIFGPVASSITPDKGPLGPRGSGQPGEYITITGAGFSDPYLENNVTVFFGLTEATSSSIMNDSTIITTSPWVEPSLAKTDVDITMIFNNCNSTSSGVTHNWGPLIYSLTGPFVFSSNDIWGLFYNGGQNITVSGVGFSEFVSDGVFQGRCLIHGDAVTTYYINDATIVCTTRVTDFGTNTSLAIEFGDICNTGSDINWRNVVTASQRLHFTPEITNIFPTFGHTSGGESVTITGQGFFNSYSSFVCLFGHYSNLIQATVSVDGTTVVCSTPTDRAEFNTDVRVAVLLDDSVDERGDKVVYSPQKYHYGPVCTDITPSSAPLSGAQNAIVTGSGFVDCSNSSTFPFKNCVFNQYQVAFYNPITNVRTFLSAPTNKTGVSGNTDSQLKFSIPAGNCGYEPVVQVAFYPPLVSTFPSSGQNIINCTNSNRPYFFHYGPIFTAQSSEFYQNGVSFGWAGDAVTISGSNFRDTQIFNGNSAVRCHVGNQLGTVDFVAGAGNSLRCIIPPNSFDYLGQISIEWSGASKSCLASAGGITAQKFHYGPVIQSITPTRGYVNSQTLVTISGFAFQCCGINSYSCLFPPTNPPKVDDTHRIGDTVTCTVPANTYIDQQINNIGVGFSGNKWTGENNLTLTQNGAVLTFYYGPYVTGISPSRASLSGRNEVITVIGEGFNDPYFLEAFCDFFSTTGGTNVLGTVPLLKANKTDTTLVCQVPQFCRNCGSIDNVRPRWRRFPGQYRSELGKYYYKTVGPAVPQVAASPYFVDGGSLTPAFVGDLVYGPTITSVCSNSLCGANIPVSPLTGGVAYNVTFDSLRDFVSSSNTSDFGIQRALCVFGNIRSTSYSIINQNPDSNSAGYVTCISPPGSVSWNGQIKVLLNPNVNVLTSAWHWIPYVDRINRNYINSIGHDTVVFRGAGFCQYAYVRCTFNGIYAIEASIIDDYHLSCIAPPNEPNTQVNVQLGFCDAGVGSNGQCNCDYFDGTTDSLPIITNNQNSGEFVSSLVYAGVSSINPSQGSACGGAIVTVSGAGFSNFDQIYCSWGGAPTLANVTSDSQLICQSIDYSPYFSSRIAQCVQSELVGFRNGNKTHMAFPTNFEYGVARVLSLTPSVIDFDNFPASIDVRGEYFDSYANTTGFQCMFGNVGPTNGTLVLDNHPTFSAYKLVCPLPASSSFVIGQYFVEVKFPCRTDLGFSADRTILTISQNPTIATFYPTSGPVIGGQNVSIYGTGLAGGSGYFCSFGNYTAGNSTLVGASYNATTGTVNCKSPFIAEARVDSPVILAVSIDGGATFYQTRTKFLYDLVVGHHCNYGAASALQASILMTVSVAFFGLLAFF